MRLVLLLWICLHAAAHIITFWQDVPLLAHAVATLPAGTTPRYAPVQVGGHYAYWPARPGRPCLLEPVWVWTAWRVPADLRALRAATVRMLEQPAAGSTSCQPRPEAPIVTWRPEVNPPWR